MSRTNRIKPGTVVEIARRGGGGTARTKRVTIVVFVPAGTSAVAAGRTAGLRLVPAGMVGALGNDAIGARFDAVDVSPWDRYLVNVRHSPRYFAPRSGTVEKGKVLA